jgi:hypothetical protein
MISGEGLFGLYLQGPPQTIQHHKQDEVLLAVSMNREKLENMDNEGKIIPMKVYELTSDPSGQHFITEQSKLLLPLGKVFGYQRTTRSGVKQSLLLISNNDHDSDEYVRNIKAVYDISKVPVELDVLYWDGVMNA